MRKKTKYFQFRIILLLFFIASFPYKKGMAAIGDQPGNIVISINGIPVYEDEFEFVKQGLRTECITYFINKYGTYDCADFWEHSFKGEVPRLWLKEKTMAKCKTQRVLVSLMNKYGVLKSFNFSSFKTMWKKENLTREAEVKNSGLVYGTIGFDQQTYYTYLISKSILDTEREIVRKSDLSEKQWRAYYETIKTKQFRKLPSKEIVLYRNNNKTIDTVKVKFDASGNKTDELVWGAVYARSLSLNQTGQLSDHFRDTDGNDCFIKCASITDNGVFIYREVADNVKMLYADQVMANLMKRMSEECLVENYYTK